MRTDRRQRASGNGITSKSNRQSRGRGADTSDSEQGLRLDTFLNDEDTGHADDADLIRHKPSEAFSGETLSSPKAFSRDDSPQSQDGHGSDVHDHAHGPLRKAFGQHKPKSQGQSKEKKWKGPFTGTIIRHVPKNGKDNDDEDDEEELDVQMWENHHGKLVMEVPWFRSKPESA